MELVKLGKRGQVSIPRGVLRKLGIEGEQTLIVEVGPDGAIVMRQAGVYPLETYTDERLREFERADRMTPAEEAQATRRLGPRRRR